MSNKSFEVPDPSKILLSAINLAEYNPRVITQKELGSLKASIRKHGLVLNLVIQARSDEGSSNILIGGHQRIRAMREICEEDETDPPESVWCTILDIADKEAKMLNVALNSISGAFDPQLLGKMFEPIFDTLKEEDFDSIGFDFDSIKELIETASETLDEEIERLEAEVVELQDANSSVKAITLTLLFDTQERKSDVKNAIKEAVELTGTHSGAVVEEGLKLLLEKLS